MKLSKSSIGKISTMTIFLVIIIVSLIFLKQTGIVKAQNEVVESNVTENETYPNLTNNTPSNVSSNEIANETYNERKEAIFDIALNYPQKITRGESITAKASVSNTGSSSVRNVVMMWKLANGFEVVSGNLEERCGDLEARNTCVSEVNLKTDFSTSLGLNDIKIVVNYE